MFFLYFFFTVLFYTQIIDKNKAENAFSYKADQSILNLYDINSSGSTPIKLHKDLSEISGITILNGNKIFTHNDEEGKIFQIDYSTGRILKAFLVGREKIFEDFEDIAAADGKLFLVTSSGVLFRFSEGHNKEKVNYDIYETGLNRSYNVEGLCYDKKNNSLLLACKEYAGRGYDNSKAVYEFSLNKNKLASKPRFLINLKEIQRKFGIKNFSPSAITRYSGNGNFLILSSHVRSIIEVNPEGKIIAAQRLSKDIHPQPEGIAFMDDNTLLISDEHKKGGIITFYKPKK